MYIDVRIPNNYSDDKIVKKIIDLAEMQIQKNRSFLHSC